MKLGLEWTPKNVHIDIINPILVFFCSKFIQKLISKLIQEEFMFFNSLSSLHQKKLSEQKKKIKPSKFLIFHKFFMSLTMILIPEPENTITL